MAIYIDQIVTHGSGNTGDDTVPPGISGLDWCHIVSTDDELELTTFLTLNILTIGVPLTSVRSPVIGSRQTYAGLDATQRAAAIAAGAHPMRVPTTATSGFDSPGSAPFYEP